MNNFCNIFPSEKKNNRIKELEPRVKSAAEAINSLKDIIKKKDDEIKTQEEKYKRFLGKAKQVSRLFYEMIGPFTLLH